MNRLIRTIKNRGKSRELIIETCKGNFDRTEQRIVLRLIDQWDKHDKPLVIGFQDWANELDVTMDCVFKNIVKLERKNVVFVSSRNGHYKNSYVLNTDIAKWRTI